MASSIGTRIRDARERMGLTQNEVGRRAGISTGYLSRLERDERGGNLTILIADRLRLALGMPPGWPLEENPTETTEDAAEVEALPEPQRMAIACARIMRYPDVVVRRAVRYRHGPELSADEWLDRMRAWRFDLREEGTPIKPKPRPARSR